MVALTRLEKIICCLAIVIVYNWRKIAVTLLVALATFVLIRLADAAETADLVMKSGADYRAKLTWTDPTGRAVDITGRTYVAQFRSAPSGGTLFATYSCIITDAPKGKMEIRLSRARTVALSGKAGVWDLKQTDAGGVVTYRFGGVAKVMPTVTAP